MQEHILYLLFQCQTSGIRLSLSNDGLLVKYPKGKEIDKDLLFTIKATKSQLIAYLKQVEEENNTQSTLTLDIPTLTFNNSKFYEITPNENYWLDDSIDKDFKNKDKIHGYCFMQFEMRGKFNFTLFQNAVAELIKRHESLRTTFHFIDNRYVMKVEDELSPLFATEIKSGNAQNASKEEIKEFIEFTGHKFSICQGPLFLVRLIDQGDDATILSMKIHHVIIDTWSVDLIINDLFTIYKALINNTIPTLTTLKYQLKEYLACTNEYRKLNYDNHKRYWHNLYSSLPKELIIPIPTKCSPSASRKIADTEHFVVANKILNELNLLAKKFSTTLFIVLQAAFKYFMYNKTKQNDITIGTYTFGRELGGSEDQIGCFAKTALVRTIFDDSSGFEGIVDKVKKANDDMRTYNAFTLKQMFREMIHPHDSMHGTFWKINIQFDNIRNSIPKQQKFLAPHNQLNLQICPINTEPNSHIQIDIHLQFIRSETTLQLFVEYDSCQYDKIAIRTFVHEYLFELQRMTNPHIIIEN